MEEIVVAAYKTAAHKHSEVPHAAGATSAFFSIMYKELDYCV